MMGFAALNPSYAFAGTIPGGTIRHGGKCMPDVMRRHFIVLLGGAATLSSVWPLRLRAETAIAVRRVGVLSTFVEDNSESRRLMAVFARGLNELGWTEGRNIHLEQRWSGGDNDRLRSDARELASLRADVVMAVTTPAVAALKQEAPAIPVVFVAVSDPVGSGFINSLPRPGGNITGFINLEGSLSGKWLELLKEVAPSLTHVGFIFNPERAPFAEYYLRAFEAAAPAAGVTPLAMPVHTPDDIERVLAQLGAQPAGGFIVMPDTFTTLHRGRIISAAARHRLAAVYASGTTARQGGLIGYGVDDAESVRGAASYVDRILKGAKAADLPVQTPAKFELVINLKTAKALGLEIPPTLLARADEVIE
jgi:putative tryptophan/tyrosine transport system substrate-binding protein